VKILKPVDFLLGSAAQEHQHRSCLGECSRCYRPDIDGEYVYRRRARAERDSNGDGRGEIIRSSFEESPRSQRCRDRRAVYQS